MSVKDFEKALADYCEADYAICVTNGTVSLEIALKALGIQKGDRVSVPPLTMASSTIGILHAGGIPVFRDVDADTWLMDDVARGLRENDYRFILPVSLYGLHQPYMHIRAIDDAAQTLRKHSGCAFTSLSFQRSKILNLGEGGALLTNDETLATAAREYSSLGYRLSADSSKIDKDSLKTPAHIRHHTLGINARMNDLTAAEGLRKLAFADDLRDTRGESAFEYMKAFEGCEWAKPQYIPEGWRHDWWTYAVALESAELWTPFVDAIVRHGGEMPYGAWRLTYQEPAFKHLDPTFPDFYDGGSLRSAPKIVSRCPVAESLQPRLLQLQTNCLASAERNARAVRKAIHELNVSKWAGAWDKALTALDNITVTPGEDWYRRKTTGYRGWGDDSTGTPCS